MPSIIYIIINLHYLSPARLYANSYRMTFYISVSTLTIRKGCKFMLALPSFAKYFLYNERRVGGLRLLGCKSVRLSVLTVSKLIVFECIREVPVG
jgi:hypothetical protein